MLYYIHRWVTQGKSIKYVSDSWQLIMPLLVFYEPSLDLQRNCFQISTKNITFNFNDTYYVLLPHQWLMGVRFRLINISQSKLWTFPMTSIHSIGPHTGWVRCHGARQGIDKTDHESFIKGTQKSLGVGLRWVGSQRRIWTTNWTEDVQSVQCAV